MNKSHRTGIDWYPLTLLMRDLVGALVVAIVTVSSVFAGRPALLLTEQEQAVLEKYPVIRLAVEADWAPIDFIDSTGNYRGLTSDYVDIIADRLGIEFEPVWKPSWAEKESMLRNNQLDAAGSIVKNELRSQYLVFSAPYFHSHKSIFAKKTHPISRLKNQSRISVAVEQGYSVEQELREFYPKIKLIVVEDTRAALEAVSFSKADAYIGNRAVTQLQIEKYQFTDITAKGLSGLPDLDFRIALRKELAPLIPAINKVLASISPNEKQRIQRRWIGQTNGSELHIELSRNEQAWLDKHPIIKFSGDPNWPPIEYADQEGKYQGMVSEYMQLIAQALKTDFKYVLKADWNEALQSAKRLQVDLLPEIAKTPDRLPYLNFTRPYIELPFAIFTLEDLRYVSQISDLIGKRVAVEEGYVTKETIEQQYPDIVLQSFPSAPESLKALSEGKVDAYVGSLAVSSYLIQEQGFNNIKVAAITEHGFELGIGVRKDWPELIPILQKALDGIGQKQRLAIRKNWLAIDYEGTQGLDYELFWKIVIGAAFILLCGLAWNNHIRRQRHILSISEERFRLAMDASSEGIWDWNIESGEVYFSPGYMRMLGFEPDEMQARHSTWEHLLHPEDRETAVGFVDRAIHEKRSNYEHEFRLRVKNGGYRQIHSIGSVVSQSQDGKPLRAVGTQKDITDKKAAEERLMVFQRFAETSGQGFVIADLDATIKYRNKRLAELLEESSNSKRDGDKIADYYPPEISQRVEHKIIPRTILQGQWAGELDVITATGKVIPTIESFFLIKDKNGEPIYIGVVVTDISEQKSVQQGLEQAKRLADQASRSKSEFLANMSHEIRTPLNAIVGMSYLASQTKLSPRQSDYNKKIQGSAQILLSVVNDILDFSKIEAGKLNIERVEFNLDQVLENMADLALINADEKDLELIYYRSADVPNNLYGDPLRLGQVLSNLVSNAVKFTSNGEVVVHIERQDLAAEQVWLRFLVTDTGVGIDGEELAHLFEPFRQADGSTTRKYGGTGLGLSICRQLVEKMGGQISAQSTLGQGSKFKFELPFDLSVDESMRGSNDSDIEGLKILVVDEKKVVRRALSKTLQSFSYEVVAALSGQQAIDLLGEKKSTFQVALLDLTLPDMDVAKLAKKLNGGGTNQRIPVVAMCNALTKAKAIQTGVANLFSVVLSKPASTSQLLGAIFEAIHIGPVASQFPTIAGQTRLRPCFAGRVLVAEDNAINQQVAKELLEQFGLTVYTVINGLHALDALRKNEFDLVLMDIQMPEMDGLEATRQIRKQSQFDDLPVVAMTAHAMKRDQEKTLAAGMNDHVAKPIDPDHLYAVLARYLDLASEALNSNSIYTTHTANQSVLPDTIPGIDYATGLTRTGGGERLYLRLLIEFCQDHGGDVDTIKSFIAANDIEAAKTITHTLYGVAGNLGAIALCADIKILDNEMHTLDEAKLELIFDRMSKGLTDIVDGLGLAPVMSSLSVDQTAVGGKLATSNQLDAVKTLLIEGDVRAIQLIRSFRSSPARDRILKFAENYDFDDALTVLSSLATENSSQNKS